MTRYCQHCGRRATHWSSAPRSDGRRRSDDAHDLCGRCIRKAMERVEVDQRAADRVRIEIDETWREREAELAGLGTGRDGR